MGDEDGPGVDVTTTTTTTTTKRAAVPTGKQGRPDRTEKKKKKKRKRSAEAAAVPPAKAGKWYDLSEGNPSFPSELYLLLQDFDMEESVSRRFLRWLPCGKVFAMRSGRAFLCQFLLRHTALTKVASFERALYMFGFEKLSHHGSHGGNNNGDDDRKDGPGGGPALGQQQQAGWPEERRYRHPNFVNDQPQKLKRVVHKYPLSKPQAAAPTTTTMASRGGVDGNGGGSPAALGPDGGITRTTTTTTTTAASASDGAAAPTAAAVASPASGGPPPKRTLRKRDATTAEASAKEAAAAPPPGGAGGPANVAGTATVTPEVVHRWLTTTPLDAALPCDPSLPSTLDKMIEADRRRLEGDSKHLLGAVTPGGGGGGETDDDDVARLHGGDRDGGETDDDDVARLHGGNNDAEECIVAASLDLTRAQYGSLLRAYGRTFGAPRAEAFREVCLWHCGVGGGGGGRHRRRRPDPTSAAATPPEQYLRSELGALSDAVVRFPRTHDGGDDGSLVGPPHRFLVRRFAEVERAATLLRKLEGPDWIVGKVGTGGRTSSTEPVVVGAAAGAAMAEAPAPAAATPPSGEGGGNSRRVREVTSKADFRREWEEMRGQTRLLFEAWRLRPDDDDDSNNNNSNGAAAAWGKVEGRHNNGGEKRTRSKMHGRYLSKKQRRTQTTGG